MQTCVRMYVTMFFHLIKICPTKARLDNEVRREEQIFQAMGQNYGKLQEYCQDCGKPPPADDVLLHGFQQYLLSHSVTVGTGKLPRCRLVCLSQRYLVSS